MYMVRKLPLDAVLLSRKTILGPFPSKKHPNTLHDNPFKLFGTYRKRTIIKGICYCEHWVTLLMSEVCFFSKEVDSLTHNFAQNQKQCKSQHGSRIKNGSLSPVSPDLNTFKELWQIAGILKKEKNDTYSFHVVPHVWKIRWVLKLYSQENLHFCHTQNLWPLLYGRQNVLKNKSPYRFQRAAFLEYIQVAAGEMDN